MYTKLSTSIKSAAVAVVMAAMASAPASADETTPTTTPETTPQTAFAVVAQLPVAALSSAEMAETRGTFVGVAYVNYAFVGRQGGSSSGEWQLFFDGSAIGH